MIDAAHIAFLRLGLAVSLASCGAGREVNLARGIACRLSADGARVVVFLPLRSSAALLADVAGNGRLAALFTQPSTHRSLQFKTDDACRCAIEPGDAAVIAANVDAFVLEVMPLGFTEAVIRHFFAYESQDLTALAFTPQTAFDQTPGPQAGQALGLAP